MTATPPVTSRSEYDARWAEPVAIEKVLTDFGDRVSARRRTLPITPIDDYRFTGPDGPVRLSQLFGDAEQLVLQSFMFHPDREEGCPSCTWAADNLPTKLDELLAPNRVRFAMVSRTPIAKLQAWSDQQGWAHLRWVSSQDTTFATDWG